MSGGFNPINMVSQVALAAMTGGASLYLQLAMQVMSQVGQQVIQQLGQQMGLDQSVIDLAQGAFAGSMGDVQGSAQNLDEAVSQFGQFQGASPTDIGEAQRTAQEGMQQLLNELSESDEVREAKSSGGKGGGGWLRAMAEVLGEKLDALAHEMEDLAGKVTKEDPSTTTDFTVVSQQFNMLMNATSTALKTVGEAMGKSASRQ